MANEKKVTAWETVGEPKLAAHTRIFDVKTVRHRSPDGSREGEFVFIDSPDWVTAIPHFYDEKTGAPMTFLVRQYRHGSGRVTVEFPAGLIEKGEDPVEAGGRELSEETGASFTSAKLIGSLCPNSAFMNNTVNFVLFEGCRIAGEQHLDKNEEIEIITLPLAEAMEKMGVAPEFDNGIQMIAVAFLEREAASRPELLQTHK